MATLNIKIGAFVSSPAEMQAERDIVANVLAELSAEARDSRAHIETFRWERDARPSLERPLDGARRALRQCDLVIAVFGDTLGTQASLDHTMTGTQEELELASTLHAEGRLDDVFVYFRRARTDAPASSFRDELRRRFTHTFWDFDDARDLHDLATRHARRWFAKWHKIMPACWYALARHPIAAERGEVVGDARLQAALVDIDLDRAHPTLRELGKWAVARYQASGVDSWCEILPVSAADIASSGLRVGRAQAPSLEPGILPLLCHRDGAHACSTPDWFFFLCAFGLVHGLARRELAVIAHRAYLNPAHQYLPPLARRLGIDLGSVLAPWLRARDVPPIARNFAAYQLGMLGDRRHIDLLYETLVAERDPAVRIYCITSLGKLKAKKYQGPLFDEFLGEEDPAIKLTIAEAICRIVGVADFEL